MNNLQFIQTSTKCAFLSMDSLHSQVNGWDVAKGLAPCCADLSLQKQMVQLHIQ
jgi:hypothetical protein